MIVRIVKMVFQPDKVNSFSAFSKEISPGISQSEGCRQVEVLQDIHHPATFFTYSTWDSEEHLQKYRQSDFFKNNWATVKPWFAEKAVAWSVKQL